jgi:hypothetical protein
MFLKKIKWIGLILLVLLSMVGVFFIGQKMGAKSVKTSFFTHIDMVKEIAELGTLEVKGVANVTITNVDEDSWFSFLKKTFMEKTVNLSMPYTAKFGVDMQSNVFNITDKETEIEVTLPPAKLLSFEGHLDQKQGMIQKGYFMFPDENAFKEAESKLYSENKKKLESNKEYLEKAEKKVSEIMQKYFKPFNKPVKVVFVQK